LESKKGHHLFTQQQNVSLLQSIADQKKSTLNKLEIIKQIKLKLLEAQQEIEKI
jgi:flagellar biosynthesis/type III secretory pathway chaperone